MALLDTVKAERLAKIEKLNAAGMDPYPAHTDRTHSIETFLHDFASFASSQEEVTLAGRVLSIREHGGALFIDLFDGTKSQGYLQKEKLGDLFNLFRETVDQGDFIECRGVAYTTKRGQPSLDVVGWRMLSKSLRPLPDEWFGIKDEDERFRKRYLDILLTPDLFERAKRRSVFWNSFRSFLLERGYIEVETPVLETTTGGADARPFVTHHNALDLDVYLRISAGELWQKRLMVAGLSKTFEIGRIFRNEGMSAEHAQDYTQIEFYEAFSDYEAGMKMIEELYRFVAEKTFGTLTFSIKGFDIDLGASWKRYDFCELVKEAYGCDPRTVSVEEVRTILDEKQIAYDPQGFNLERGVDLLWKQVRKSLGGPGFLVNVPVYLETLAKRSSADPRVVERFQVILAGSEMGKGFSELNDPVDQAERFARQQALRDLGDDEAQMNDADYVEAMEYGMPPTFGFGVSERLFSTLAGVSIREAQLFPLLRPR